MDRPTRLLLLTLAAACLASAGAARSLLAPPAATEVVVANASAVGETSPGFTDPFDARWEMAPDQLIVQLRPSPKNRTATLARGKASVQTILRKEGEFAGRGELLTVTVSLKDLPAQANDRARLAQAAKLLRGDVDVEFVEPNYVMRKPVTLALPTDPDYVNGGLWGMRATTSYAGGANAEGAWAAGFDNCTGAVIGVIDEGIQVTHPDLVAAIWANPREAAGAGGVDDDANGRADDVNGWDFFNRDSSVFDGGVDAAGTNLGIDNHGTHVAGTIGGVGNNGQGVVGVCPKGVQLISGKFLGAGGGYISDAVLAMNYLLALKKNYGLNMVATSNSWGGGPYTQSMFDAIAAHRDNNILFIAAAGNEMANTDTTATYPQAYALDNVISVGSLTSSGAVSSFSNYGASTVDLFAPGSAIKSTVSVSSYATYSGTSMATPHVSGAAALYASNFNQTFGRWPTYAEVKSALFTHAKPNAALAGKCVTGKQLDIGAALASLASGSTPPPPGLTMKISGVKTTVTLNAARASRATAFTCTFQWTVVDAATNAPVANPFITAVIGVNPDDTTTDKNLFFPFTVSGDMGATGVASYTTPSIPTKLATKRTTGTACTMSVSSLTHATYVLDATRSVMTATSSRY